MASFDQDKRGQVLQFTTGTSRVPLDGYVPPLTITAASDLGPDALPKVRSNSCAHARARTHACIAAAELEHAHCARCGCGGALAARGNTHHAIDGSCVHMRICMPALALANLQLSAHY